MSGFNRRPLLPSAESGSITPASGQVTRVYPSAFVQPREEDAAAREIHLLDYWRVIRKRKWIVLGVMLSIVSVVAVRMYRSPAIYEASSRVILERQEPVRLSDKDSPVPNIYWNDPQYLETQLNVLRSRTLAKRVIDKLTLDRRPEYQPIAGRDTDPLLRDKLLIDAFLSNLSVDLTRNTRVVNLTYASRDPGLAAEVINTLTREYIGYTLDARASTTQQAKDWLNKRVAELRGRAQEVEEDLLKYTRDKQIVQLGEKQTIAVDRLEGLSKRFSDVEMNRLKMEGLYRLTKEPGVNVDVLPPVVSDETVTGLTAEMGKLRQGLIVLLSTFQPTHPKVVQVQQQLHEVERELAAQKQRILANVEAQYKAALTEEQDLRRELEKQRAEALEQNARTIELGLKQGEVQATVRLYGELLSKLNDVSLLSTMTTTNIQILDLAEVPLAPARPRKLFSIGLSVLVGLVLGVGMAFFIEYLDNTVKSTEEVDRLLGLPALGVVPALESLNKRSRLALPGFGNRPTNNSQPLLTMQEHDRSNFGEAYRSLRTSILLSSPEHPPRSILFTSSNPGEGKTTTAINTAISLAQTGARVIIVDGDLRKPGVHKALQLKSTPGLSSYLTRPIELSSVINVEALPNLSVIPSGAVPPNPSELLSSAKMREAVRELCETYEYVVIDSPPISTPDALILSTIVDGVIMVIRCGETPKEVVSRAKRALEDVNARIFGVVLNRIDVHEAGYYYYYYRYHYSAGDQAGNQPAP